jgi:putative oxidoreductase
MTPILTRYSPHTYALLRIFAGVMFMMHGTQKLFAWPGGKMAPLASLRGVGGVIETFGGLAIAIGLYASVAAFIASGMMAVAYFLSHASGGFFPIVNRGELAVLYCFLFLYVAAAGSGIWSVDQLRSHGGGRRSAAESSASRS